jgi:hypothetical protein
MISRLDGAPSLPIKDDVDLAVEARTQEILRDYDVTPEEAAQMARAEVMQDLDRQPLPTPVDALARQHQDAGASPADARRQAQGQVRVYGPQGAWGLSREYDTPEGMARLMEAQAENKAADARHQQMYDDYFTATNAPSHQRVTPETQRQWDDTGRYVAESRRIREAGLHPNTPVDPVDPSARYKSDEEADQKKASRDAHMEGVFKNIRHRYGPEEEAAAREAYSRGEVHVPQKSAQRSRNEYRKNLEYTAMGDGDNADEARQRLRAMEAGVNYDDLKTPEEKAALRAPGGNMSAAREDSMMRRLRVQAGLHGQQNHAAYNDAGMLRELIAGNREAKREQNETQWRARAMLQGGNAIGALALPGLNQWQASAIRGGPTPLDVEARQAAAAAEMARQAITGFLANSPQAMTPAQQQMADVKTRQEEESLPPDAAAGRERNRNGGVLPSSSRAGQRVLQQIDTDVIGPFATDSEIETAVEEAKARGIPEAEARAYFDRRRRDVFFFGTRLRPPATPAGAGGGAPAGAGPAPPGPPPGEEWPRGDYMPG